MSRGTGNARLKCLAQFVLLPLLRVRGRAPRKIVVHDCVAVTVIAFEPPADGAHPCIMHIAGQHAEVVERRVGKEFYEITAKNIRYQKANRNISTLFRRYLGNNDEIAFWEIFNMKSCWRICYLLCRNTLARQSKFPYRLYALITFGHLFYFSRRTISKP